MRKQRRNYTPGRKGRHFEAASAGERAAVEAVRRVASATERLLRVAEAEFFENGTAAFQNQVPASQQVQRQLESLKRKVEAQDEVLAEMMAEHVALKKVLGNAEGHMGTARRARRDRGLCPALEPAQRDPGWGWAPV
jgi:hypothetical protein